VSYYKVRHQVFGLKRSMQMKLWIYVGMQDLKIQLNKVNIELMQKERSDVYHRKLKRLLENFSQTREHIDPLTKKELLQFVFKDILIKNKVIVKISFYQPFARYWEELK